MTEQHARLIGADGRRDPVALMAVRRKRFAERWVPVPEAGCWLWIGAIRRNLGRKNNETRPFQGKSLAYRLSWELHRGPIPAGMMVCHKCDTPLCVNPDHLYVGTAFDNAADSVRRNRCARRFGELSPTAKLTATDVTTVRALRAAGMRCRDIACVFPVSHETVSDIVRRKTWSHVA